MNNEILLVEKLTQPIAPWKDRIAKLTGWTVQHTESSTEAGQFLREFDRVISIVLMTIDHDHEQALSVLRSSHSRTDNGIVCPAFLVLSRIQLPPATRERFLKLGALWLPRKHEDVILETIELVKWRMEHLPRRPLIRIVRSFDAIEGVSAFGPNYQPVELRMGGQLRRLVQYLAGRGAGAESTTTMIADELGVCQQTVKKYMKDLRDIWNAARGDIGTTVSGHEIFWTKKRPGGTVHSLLATVFWEKGKAQAQLAIAGNKSRNDSLQFSGGAPNEILS